MTDTAAESSSGTEIKASTSSSSTRIATPPLPKVSTSTNNSKRTNNVMIRFHFIRHGETEANLQKLVLGQTESPLTRQGKEQAKKVGQAFLKTKVWGYRIYCSDLQRAKETSKIISNTFSAYTFDNGEDKTTTKQYYTSLIIQPDSLLRERAKGIREGKLKSLSEEECFKLHKMEEVMKGAPIAIPLLENDEQVWKRFQTFITNIVTKVVHEYNSVQRLTTQDKTNNALMGAFDETTTDKQQQEEAKIINILVVTHSGAIRILINKLLSDDTCWNNGEKDGNLKVDLNRIIPNCSITMIDIEPIIIDTSKNQNQQQWCVRRLKLPNIDHLLETKPASATTPTVIKNEQEKVLTTHQ